MQAALRHGCACAFNAGADALRGHHAGDDGDVAFPLKRAAEELASHHPTGTVVGADEREFGSPRTVGVDEEHRDLCARALSNVVFSALTSVGATTIALTRLAI